MEILKWGLIMKKYIIFLLCATHIVTTYASVGVYARAGLQRLRSGLQTMSAQLKSSISPLKGKRTFMTDSRYEAMKRLYSGDKIEVQHLGELATYLAFHRVDIWQEAIRRNDLASLTRMADMTTGLLKKDQNGSKLLFEAVEANRPEIVRFLITKCGVNPNELDSEGRTPLTHAVMQGKQGAMMANLLIEEGADVNLPDKNGTTPLIAAISNQEGSYDCVKLLLDNGAKIDERGQGRRTALFRAARLAKNGPEGAEALKIFRELLLRNASITLIDEQDKTILHIIAMWDNHTEALEILRPYKATLNINAFDDHGKTALQYAAERGDFDAVEMLVDGFGVDINAQWNRWFPTALTLAEQRQHQKIAEYLRARGAKKKFDFTKIGLTESRITKGILITIGLASIKLLSLFQN